MGSQVSSKIVGIGDIIMTTNTGCKVVLKDVRHVPDMHLNLISVGKLDDVGLVNHFGGGKWKSRNGSLIVARCVNEGSLYVMQGKLYKGDVNIVQDNSNLALWHKRLGQASEKELQILARNELIAYLKGKLLEPCTDYLAGKQHRVTFKRGSTLRGKVHS